VPPSAALSTRTVHAEPVMGTVVSIDIRDPGEWSAMVASLSAWFHEVDRRFSTFREDSEICRLGRGELHESECSPDVREVLGLCAEVEAMSHGCFAARIGDRLDPSALVKGWSVERAAAMLTAAGARNFFVGAGGDVAVRGRAVGEERWRVGIRHPDIADRVAAVFEVEGGAVATSGAYERGAHITDPRTGEAARGLLSMTVVGPSLTYADAFATAAYVMGEAGAAWIAGIPEYEALIVTADHRVVATPGFPPTGESGDPSADACGGTAPGESGGSSAGACGGRAHA
jgi:thiamine biosynthesis lipoprotein